MKILEHAKQKSPLKRNISADDVANLALFLCSDMSKNITGQVINVDAGSNCTTLDMIMIVILSR